MDLETPASVQNSMKAREHQGVERGKSDVEALAMPSCVVGALSASNSGYHWHAITYRLVDGVIEPGSETYIARGVLLADAAEALGEALRYVALAAR